MKTVTINQAQTDFFQLVNDVSAGEEIIIADNTHPLAVLSPYHAPRQVTLGVWQGKAQLDDAIFDSADQDILEMFETSQLFPTV